MCLIKNKIYEYLVTNFLNIMPSYVDMNLFYYIYYIIYYLNDIF